MIIMIFCQQLSRKIARSIRSPHCRIYFINIGFSPRYHLSLPSLFARLLSRSEAKFSKTQREICRRINYSIRGAAKFSTFVNRAELKRHTDAAVCQHAGEFPLFFSSHAPRPPCQCVDALNWLVILIEFHYSSARQWTASFNEREWTVREGEGKGGKRGRGSAEQPHFPRLITEKRFTRACRAGNSKNADNPSGTNRTSALVCCENVFRRVCKRVKYISRISLIKLG